MRDSFFVKLIAVCAICDLARSQFRHNSRRPSVPASTRVSAAAAPTSCGCEAQLTVGLRHSVQTNGHKSEGDAAALCGAAQETRVMVKFFGQALIKPTKVSGQQGLNKEPGQGQIRFPGAILRVAKRFKL